MASSSMSYLFVEFAVLCFMLGFFGEEFRYKEFRNLRIWKVVLGFAVFWFLVDQIAIWIGLWTFPAGTSLPFRFFSLPLEECMLFFLHTFLCLVLLRHYSVPRR